MKEMDIVIQKESAAEDKASKKFCTDCNTTKTPLWRGGPSGPKSLCNACGIRYRKKKRTTSTSSPATNRSESPEKKRDGGAEESKSPSSSKCLSSSLKVSLVLLGKDLSFEKTKNVANKQRRQRKRKIREEELAAASLVALSCGSVFA